MNSKFNFIVPAELSKSDDGEWKIKGLASTQSVDLQGETIIQKGIDLSPIDKKKGIINFDHLKGPENTIGLLDGYSQGENGLYIEGRLFKNHTKAKAVHEIMSSLGEGDRGRVGLSVEGQILERDPQNPKIIRKCRINAVAVTLSPVNSSTYADLVKSMSAGEVEFDSQETSVSEDYSGEVTFTATQVIEMVNKALTMGAPAAKAPVDRSGGDALAMQSMDTAKKKPKKKKMKKMDKCMYKSNIIETLDKMQILYPECTKAELWAALRERLTTTFPNIEEEFGKGGVGSGRKGHTTPRNYTPKKEKYSWGTFRHLEDKKRGMSAPIHPEHWDEIKAVHSGKKESSSYKDETGAEWKVNKHPEGGVHLTHESIRGRQKFHLNDEQMKNLD